MFAKLPLHMLKELERFVSDDAPERFAWDLNARGDLQTAGLVEESADKPGSYLITELGSFTLARHGSRGITSKTYDRPGTGEMDGD